MDLVTTTLTFFCTFVAIFTFLLGTMLVFEVAKNYIVSYIKRRRKKSFGRYLKLRVEIME